MHPGKDCVQDPSVMKTQTQLPRKEVRARRCMRRQQGFALVVTLSLMILLTILAVGLLSLSSLSLRSAGQGDAQRIAQANARLALALALAQLQKHTGPDQVVTMTADQRGSAGDGSQSSAAVDRRHWAGAYRSWLNTTPTRPTPEFLSWLVSGEESLTGKPESADQAGAAADAVELVGTGTLGETTATGTVKVPPIRIAQANGRAARAAWWIGDQGVKAAIAAPPPSQDTSLGGTRAALQGAPRNAVEWVSTGTAKPFASLGPDDRRTERVTSWKQAGLLTTDAALPRAAFHDLAPFSTGLMTNVRAGGFRKDLSMELERAAARAPKTPLYRVRGETGINFEELWAYYNLYKEVQRRGTHTFTTGGRLANSSPFLQMRDTPNTAAQDDWFFFKQPVIINYQMVFSFEIRPINSGGAIVNSLRLVADPIITLWNPLDIPLVIPTGAYMSVKYWQYPFDVMVRINGGTPIRSPMISTLSGSTVTTNTDYNFLTLKMGNSQPMVFRPGEVIKFSQNNNTIVREGFSRNLNAGPGFQFDGGVSLPLKDLNGQTINLQPTDTITYEVRPNNLTAGKSSSSGNSLSGTNLHSRHFSITHHEVYVGHDRQEGGQESVGYGGMAIDWDFGNRRLKPGEVRAIGTPGTKPAGERLYADNRALSQVFKSITSSQGRSYSFSELNGRKEPFMIASFEAKTEEGSDRGTRSLARFNPKAHHIDFYDLKAPELDMLPYEFKVEPLTSWKNRSLEVSTNGNAYFGGGMNAEYGTSFLTTHTVPREPIFSLAMFQHAFANGFEMQKPTVGYANLNGREPMLPQISHAIGNSLAPSVLGPDKTEGILAGSRPVADHSFLANRELWDDWFLSGISPQTVTTFGTRRDQRTVATEFFTGTARLPVTRYLPDIGSQDADALARSLISGTTPSTLATTLVGSLMRVDGMFNVNSTSVEAWKSVLGGLKGRPIIVREANGSESLSAGTDGKVPVANLSTPANTVIDARGSVDPKDPAQWVGYRELDEQDLDALARAIVREIRKRGPFLSLADFVNRRPGTDKDLARSGAIQSALDAPDVPINKGFRSGTRDVASDVAARLAFPGGEQGAKSFGSPGIVKQADILTPIAPILSARSDSFIIRAYGEAVAADGKVIARAWCEAVVERNRNYIDPQDKPEIVHASLRSGLNKSFGRRYEILSFRWLNPSEI